MGADMNNPKAESASALWRALFAVVFHGCLCLAGGLLLLFGIPALAEFWGSGGSKLPVATQLVMSLSFWFEKWAILLVPVGFFLLLADGLICWLLHRFLGKTIARTYFWLVLAGLAFSIGGMVFAATLPVKRLY